MTIKATEEQLNKIFNLTNYQFEIPSYQRPYAWGKDQVLELIDDLYDAFPYPLESNHPDYFFGSIILIKEEGKPNAEVIDGQQRLTTLTLLLSIIRLYFNDEDNLSFAIVLSNGQEDKYNINTLKGIAPKKEQILDRAKELL